MLLHTASHTEAMDVSYILITQGALMCPKGYTTHKNVNIMYKFDLP